MISAGPIYADLLFAQQSMRGRKAPATGSCHLPTLACPNPFAHARVRGTWQRSTNATNLPLTWDSKKKKNIITPVNLLFGEYVDFFLDVYMVYSLHNSDPRENGLPFSVFGRKEFRVDILTQCPRFPRSQLVWGLRGSCAQA